MDKHYYTGERNHQILIALLKEHNIQNVVVSPGIANSCFVGSIQADPFFQLTSVVDERSAAYIACGIAFETGKPVVISCTGATAARDYMPAMTEAYYSKLPLLVVTSSQPSNRIGHLFAQVTDRSSPPKDVANISVEMPLVKSNDDEWICEIAANQAINTVLRGGVAHLNLITPYSYNEITALTHHELPAARKIECYNQDSTLPTISADKVAIFVGNHKPWSYEVTRSVERFCEKYNGIVLCDHTSNYNGKYKVLLALAINQASINKQNIPAYNPDILIHIGEITGEEGTSRMVRGKETWRVSPDGAIRDYFRNVTKVFGMSETSFFKYYSLPPTSEPNISYFNECYQHYLKLQDVVNKQLEQIPLSNVWIAQMTAKLLPDYSTVTLGILNTLRTWNYAEFGNTIKVISPTGGFGIDGIPSLAIGASLANKGQLSFCVLGDLAFFYDMNSLGIRDIKKNLRILLINNGCGVEFKKTYAMSYRLLGEDADPYVAAKGHYGTMSAKLVKNYSTDLGFKYLSAKTKEEYLAHLPLFIQRDYDKPILFEVFVRPEDDVSALDIIHNRSR